MSVFFLTYMIFVESTVYVDMLNDPFFLLFRIVVISILIVLVVFVYKWRIKLTEIYNKHRALNNNL